MGMMNQIMCNGGILISAFMQAGAPSREEHIPDEAAFFYNWYWRICWCIPFFVAIIQICLVTMIFPYDLPVDLKKAGKIEDLTILMAKIFEARQIPERIAEINVPSDTGKKEQSYL